MQGPAYHLLFLKYIRDLKGSIKLWLTSLKKINSNLEIIVTFRFILWLLILILTFLHFRNVIL
jgi:hypothetical protein